MCKFQCVRHFPYDPLKHNLPVLKSGSHEVDFLIAMRFQIQNVKHYVAQLFLAIALTVLHSHLFILPKWSHSLLLIVPNYHLSIQYGGLRVHSLDYILRHLRPIDLCVVVSVSREEFNHSILQMALYPLPIQLSLN